MNLTILTPESEVFEGTVVSVIVPGSEGQFQILNNHAPIIAALTDGKVEVKTSEGKTLNYIVERGFVEVLNNNINVLVQGAREVNK